MFSKVNSAILVATSIFVAGCATDAERAEIARKNSLSAAIVRSMPDSGSYQRSIAAKQQERREKVINNIKNVPDWFLSDENSDDIVVELLPRVL